MHLEIFIDGHVFLFRTPSRWFWCPEKRDLLCKRGQCLFFLSEQRASFMRRRRKNRRKDVFIGANVSSEVPYLVVLERCRSILTLQSCFSVLARLLVQLVTSRLLHVSDSGRDDVYLSRRGSDDPFDNTPPPKSTSTKKSKKRRQRKEQSRRAARSARAPSAAMVPPTPPTTALIPPSTFDDIISFYVV